MNELTRYTGFQSPCAEYAEGVLSLDKKFLRNPPATIPVRVSTHSNFLGLRVGDYLLIDRSLYPRPQEIILSIVENEFILGRYTLIKGIGHITLENGKILRLGDFEGNEDCLFGVVSLLIRDFVEMRNQRIS